MNKELGLRILSQIMDWDDEQARTEFQWLCFMAAYKYDSYRDYRAGARFIERLATWLQQFELSDRHIAYSFIKEKLIYFSPAELGRLVEKFFPEYVHEDLVDKVSARLKVPKHQIWASETSIKEYQWEKRKTLFMGLSDGARIDTLRRMNVGSISNEQIVIATQIDQYKWNSLLKDLRSDLKTIKDINTEKEKFSSVYLIDDFTASGTSLLPDPEVIGEIGGKLVKFARSVINATEHMDDKCPFADDFSITVHHYIGTMQAKKHIDDVYSKIDGQLQELKLANVRFTFGMMLDSNIRVGNEIEEPFVVLCEKYYDPSIEGKGTHGGRSGTTSKILGYANCGLPVVIEHNTPNNSLPLIWAETNGKNGKHAMRPLFRRRERHSDLEQDS